MLSAAELSSDDLENTLKTYHFVGVPVIEVGVKFHRKTALEKCDFLIPALEEEVRQINRDNPNHDRIIIALREYAIQGANKKCIGIKEKNAILNKLKAFIKKMNCKLTLITGGILFGEHSDINEVLLSYHSLENAYPVLKNNPLFQKEKEHLLEEIKNNRPILFLQNVSFTLHSPEEVGMEIRVESHSKRAPWKEVERYLTAANFPKDYGVAYYPKENYPCQLIDETLDINITTCYEFEIPSLRQPKTISINDRSVKYNFLLSASCPLEKKKLDPSFDGFFHVDSTFGTSIILEEKFMDRNIQIIPSSCNVFSDFNSLKVFNLNTSLTFKIADSALITRNYIVSSDDFQKMSRYLDTYPILHGFLMVADPNETLDFIKNNRIDVNEVNGRNQTALHLAVLMDNMPLVESLLKAKPNLEVIDDDDNTPLLIALSIGNIKMVELLLKAGADINMPNAFGMTPLHLFISIENFEITQLLLKAGADCNARDDNNSTPFHFAALIGHLPIIELILNSAINLDVNAVDNHGATALHHAVLAGRLDIVIKLLMDVRSNISIKDKHGATPLCIAKQQNFSDIIIHFNFLALHSENKLYREKGATLFGELPILEEDLISIDSVKKHKK